MASIFDDSPVDGIEINISCPNVKEGGVAFGNSPDMSARVVEACRRATGKPLVTKLSPNQADIGECARRCIEAGTDALAAINTVMGMAVDPVRREPVIGAVRAGLSGPAIKPIALLKVHEVHAVAAAQGIPVIGQGGIAGPEDALEFLLAGADAVGVGTGLFYEPLLPRRINAWLAALLEREGLQSVRALSGALRLPDRGAGEPPAATVRLPAPFADPGRADRERRPEDPGGRLPTPEPAGR